MNYIKEDIDKWLNKNNDFIMQTLSELIQIKTENLPPTGNEKNGQEYLYNLVSKFIPEKNIDLFEIEEIDGIRDHPLFFATIDGVERIYKNRPNLVVKIQGKGERPSLLLSGHIDTHPATGEKWKIFKDPFSGKIKNGRMYGRGSADMKSGTLAGFLALKCLNDLKIKLKGSVLAESVVDEEFGGVNGTIASRLRYPDINFAILAEPTDLAIGIETKGGTDFKVSVKEKSLGGINNIYPNPIYKLSKIAMALLKYEKINSKIKKDKLNIIKFEEESEKIRIFTYQIASGGTTYLESQTIPISGHIYFWIEVPATFKEEKITEDLINFVRNEYFKNSDFSEEFPEFKKVLRFMEGHQTDLHHTFMSVLRQVFDTLKIEYKEKKLGMACDAYVFKKISGTEVCVLGPKGENLHGVDECVEIKSFIDLIKIMVLSSINYCS